MSNVCANATDYNMQVQDLFVRRTVYHWRALWSALRAGDFWRMRIATSALALAALYRHRPLYSAPLWLRRIVLDQRGYNFSAARRVE